MSRPNVLTYLLGNLLCLFAAWLAVAWTTYGWLTQRCSFMVPLLLFMLASSCFRASDRIARYDRWQREWNGMAPAASKLRPSLPGLGFFFPGLGLLRMLWRRRPRKRDAAVKICGKRVVLSPGLSRAYAALPPYCAPLLTPAGQAERRP